MDGFLKIAGGAIFWLGLAGTVLIALTTKGAGIVLLFYAVPFMISGAAIYALGAILNNLIAIRDAAERQNAALNAILDKTDR